MYKQLLEKIKEYQSIAIFRHINPDGDAMFSALAVFQFIKDNFKDKTVKIGGFDTYDIITRIDKISDAYIRKSLVIIVDTSDTRRVDDERFALGPYVIKIDHHPVVENYGDLNIVDPACASCTEVFCDIFTSKEFRNYELSKKTCEYLFCGLITDTNNFTTTNTTAKTLKNAAYLAEKGELKISDLVEYLTDQDIETYQKVTQIRNYFRIQDRFGYIILTKKDLKKIGLDAHSAKNHIDELGHISDINVWAFASQTEDGLYAISVRSKRGYVINKTCQKYGGGGHANAAGIKGLSKGDTDALFAELLKVSDQNRKSKKTL